MIHYRKLNYGENYLKHLYFSNQFYLNCQLATTWLSKFINIKTGECPNIGGNDGAFCYQLHNLEYNNFKPSVQLSHIVFFKKYLFDDGPWDEPLYWFDIIKNKYSRKNYPKKDLEIMKEGGYGIIKNNSNFLAILRIPKYKFRPSQADPLHLDLWFEGINLLRDGVLILIVKIVNTLNTLMVLEVTIRLNLMT